MLLTFMDVCDNFDQVEKSLAYKRLHISFLLDGDCTVIRKWCFIFLNFFPIWSSYPEPENTCPLYMINSSLKRQIVVKFKWSARLVCFFLNSFKVDCPLYFIYFYFKESNVEIHSIHLKNFSLEWGI